MNNELVNKTLSEEESVTHRIQGVIKCILLTFCFTATCMFSMYFLFLFF